MHDACEHDACTHDACCMMHVCKMQLPMMHACVMDVKNRDGQTNILSVGAAAGVS